MIKVLLGSLLVATTALGQTPAQAPKGNMTKTSSGSAVSPAKKTKTMAASSTKPLPQSTHSQDVQSGDNAIPSYRMEKDAGIRKGRNRYPAVDQKDRKNQ